MPDPWPWDACLPNLTIHASPVYKWPFYKTDQKLNAKLEELWPALHEFKEGQRARSIERRRKRDRKAFIMTNMAREALEKGVPVRQDAIRCIQLDPRRFAPFPLPASGNLEDTLGELCKAS